ncbi:AcrR family transcriptional regulator [Paenibacillus forsythiae]|uniref:AcrR family transcriptional regulator n=1 Tax=Paenibacillus forsythiae TaxID=365616 RepID=A0ABU3H4X6_9BACL|nr:AcrR family transcriptional regulator [Paenibacillus forsythiae]
MAKATIYHYFPDKEAIVQQLLEQAVSQFHTVVQTIAEVSEPKVRLRVAVEITITFLHEFSSVIQLVRQELPVRWSQIKLDLMPIYERYLFLLSQAIEQGIQAGEFRLVNSREAAVVLMNLIHGTYAASYIGGLTDDLLRSNTDSMLDIFLNGIITQEQHDGVRDRKW